MCGCCSETAQVVQRYCSAASYTACLLAGFIVASAGKYYMCCHACSSNALLCLTSSPAGKDCSTLAVLAAPTSCKPSDLASCLPSLSDAAVLLAWKAQLVDLNNTLANWTGPNPCSVVEPWPGVFCSEDGTAVVAVNVSGFGLHGLLSGSLAALTQLQVCSALPTHTLRTISLQLAMVCMVYHCGHCNTNLCKCEKECGAL